MLQASHPSCRRGKSTTRRSSAVRRRPNSSRLSLDRWVWNTFQADAPPTRLFSFLVRLSDLFKHPQPRQLKEYAAFKGDESLSKMSQAANRSKGQTSGYISVIVSVPATVDHNLWRSALRFPIEASFPTKLFKKDNKPWSRLDVPAKDANEESWVVQGGVGGSSISPESQMFLIDDLGNNWEKCSQRDGHANS